MKNKSRLTEKSSNRSQYQTAKYSKNIFLIWTKDTSKCKTVRKATAKHQRSIIVIAGDVANPLCL